MQYYNECWVRISYTDPPEEVHAARRITVGEGGVANVECNARANPEPRLFWSQQNRWYQKNCYYIMQYRLSIRNSAVFCYIYDEAHEKYLFHYQIFILLREHDRNTYYSK